MSKWLVVLCVVISLGGVGSAVAQEQPAPRPERGGQRMPHGDIVMGTVATVGVDRLTIKTTDGKEQTILVNDQTRFLESQKDIHLEDLKPGDHVFVRGTSNANQEVTALMVRHVTNEEMQRFQGAGERAFGEIVAIDKNQIKLRNRRLGERTIKIDDKTTFMKEGKPSTLADLKVGDRVMAFGKETNGEFTATEVRSGMMGPRRWGGPGGRPPLGTQGGPEGQQPPQ